MKLAIYWLVVLILAGLQVTFGDTFGLFFAAPLVLVALVALSTKIDLEQLLYMALVCGLILDSASGRDFGLWILTLLFTVLFCKLLIRTADEASVAQSVGISALLVFVLSFVQFTRVFSVGEGFSIAEYASQTLILIGYSCIWTVAIYALGRKVDTLKFKRLGMATSPKYSMVRKK